MANHFTKSQLDFIKRAENVRQFNIDVKDLQNADNQEAVRHLYHKHMFDDVNNFESLFVDSVNVRTLNSNIQKLIRHRNFNELYNPRGIAGIGPGEVMLYVLVNGASLAGIQRDRDLSYPGGSYEIKGVKYSGDIGAYTDFNLSSRISGVSTITSKLIALAKGFGLTSANDTAVSKNNMKELRRQAPAVVAGIEKEYARTASSATKQMILINNGQSVNQVATGQIFFAGVVPQNKIIIERVTQDKIKPAILA